MMGHSNCHLESNWVALSFREPLTLAKLPVRGHHLSPGYGIIGYGDLQEE
jgi:hypothetical protein